MRFKNLYLLCLAVLIFSSSCLAQKKRKLNPEDYKLWHSLALGPMSNDGMWVSFSKQYKNDFDTLYLKNSLTDFLYTFPLGRSEKMTADGALFAFLKQDTLCVLETLTGKMDKYSGVKQFELVEKGKYLLYVESSDTLKLRNLKTRQVKKIPNVEEYRLDPIKTKIAIIQGGTEKNSVKIMELATSAPPYNLFHSAEQSFQKLQWNASGKALAYYATDKITGTHAITFHKSIKVDSRPVQLKASELGHFSVNGDILLTSLYISDNGEKVFFDIMPKGNMEKTSNVWVWNSSDKQLPPKSESMRWCVWFPTKNKIFQIEDNFYENAVLTSDQKRVLLFNEQPYLPNYEYNDRYSDVYMMNLNNGGKEKIIEKQLTAHKHVIVSPKPNLIAYFKNNNWWTYNINTDTHKCVTRQLQVSFRNLLNDQAVNNIAYGFGGWTSKGQLIVYDRFDIWLISPNGKKRQKITNGRATGIRYRIYETLGKNKSIRASFFGFTAASYDPTEGLLIKTINTHTLGEGFGIWAPGKGYRQIVQKDLKILSIKKVKEKNSFQFLESSFDVSPRLMRIEENGEQNQIAQANAQQLNFYWGKSELIHYQGPDGEKLKGALFFPANFQKGKKYPMIVDIYEKKSGLLHNYLPPSLENFMGINRTVYTLEGYFVLLPDIAYTLNSPGNSALKCVLAAVDEAVKTGAIDDENIGLTGHSFGGFEVAYIVSQTDRFKAARAGSGVMDLRSFYLQIDISDRSNMERFEKGQFRNKNPFTEAGFISESPIRNVETIHTPLLLWTGGKDNLVDPWHSIKLYSALWRLQKKSTLLIYPEGIHALLKPENQKDLTLKTLEWFNHYLKNMPKKSWMK